MDTMYFNWLDSPVDVDPRSTGFHSSPWPISSYMIAHKTTRQVSFAFDGDEN